MLQDYIRTGTYYTAFLHNCNDFRDKVVMDVGAGSGMLSLFAAQVLQNVPKMHFLLSRQEQRKFTLSKRPPWQSMRNC